MTVKKWKHSGTKKHSMSDREIRNGLLSEKAAEEGIVLLKNDKKILPLNISHENRFIRRRCGKDSERRNRFR